MIRRCQILIAVTGLLVLCPLLSSAQRTPGNVFSQTYSREDGLVNCSISNDGLHAIIQFDKRIECLSTSNATKIWSREYTNESELKGHCIIWTSNHEVVVPTESGLEWVDANRGTVLAFVPFLVEGLDKLLHQASKQTENSYQIRPRRFGNVLLIPFTTGYQLVDLVHRRELYRSDEVLDMIHIEHCGPAVLIYGEMDTAIVFDADEARILAKHSVADEPIDRCRYKNLIRHKDQVAIITESNVVCYNGATGVRTGILKCDLDEVDTYDLIVLKDDLVLVTSAENILGAYSVGETKLLWTSSYGEAKRSTPTDVWPLPDGSIIVAMFDIEFVQTLVRIEGSSGRIIWEKRLVKFGRKGRPGLAYQKVFSLGFEKKQHDKPKPQVYSPVVLDSVGKQTFYSQQALDSTRPYHDWEFISLLNQKFVHQDRYADAMVRYLGQYDSVLVFQTVGDLRRMWDGAESETEFDAEGIMRIAASTGSVASFMPIPFARDYSRLNVALSFWPIPVESGSLILGSRNVSLLKLDGSLVSTEFPLTGKNSIRYDDVGRDYVSFSYKDDNKSTSYWRVTFSSTGAKRELMAYCYKCNTFGQFLDSAHVPVTMRLTDGQLEAYSVLTEVPSSWPTPLWKLTSDQLEATGIDGVDVGDDNRGSEGIYPYEDKIFVLGRDALGVIEARSGCLRTIPWKGYNESNSKKYRTYGFVPRMKHGVVYDTGNEVGFVKLVQTCDATLIGSNTEPRKDLFLAYSLQTELLFVIDTVDDRLDIYQIR